MDWAGHADSDKRRSIPVGMPTAAWTVAQLQRWLDKERTPYASSASRAELLTLAGVN
jgi:hypothetical protein